MHLSNSCVKSALCVPAGPMYGLLTNRPESVTTITEIKMITDYEAELSAHLVGHIEPPCRLARAAGLTLNSLNFA